MNHNDIIELLNSAHGIERLTCGGKSFGLEPNSSFINFGYLQKGDLNIDTPLGYEVTQESRMLAYSEIEFSKTSRSLYRITLESLELLPKQKYSKFLTELEDDHGQCAVNMIVHDKSKMIVKISIAPSYEGFFGHWLILNFRSVGKLKGREMSYSFPLAIRIGGYLVSQAVSPGRMLSSEAKPFVSKIASEYFEYECGVFTQVITPPRGYSSALASVIPMEVPLRIRQEFLSHLCGSKEDMLTYIEQKHLTTLNPFSVSSIRNYLWALGTFTFMEQLQMEKDIKNYDLRYARLKFRPLEDSSGVTVAFVVRGGSENRPKICVGDVIRIRPCKEDVGFVSAVKIDSTASLPFDVCCQIALFEIEAVVIKFTLATEEVQCLCPAPSWNILYRVPLPQENDVHKGQIDQWMRFHVRFSFEKCSFHLMHETIVEIAKCERLQEVLFPSKSYEPPLLQLPEFAGLGSELNDKQLLAIRTVISLMHYQQNVPPDTVALPPYIIYGPPGTGKTATLIQMITALVHLSPSCRILVCAPSDAAADVLAMRLPDTMKVFRLNWWQRLQTSLPLKLVSKSEITDNSWFDIPSAAILSSYSVIVSMCTTAGILRGALGVDCKFDVVIVDEASQATEVETLIPLSLCKPNGVMVIAGDPQQLGPHSRAPLFELSGKNKSFQERMLTSYHFYENLIDETCTNTKLGVFLRNNYRSQFSIIELSSKAFYANQLLESGQKSKLDSLAAWTNLAKVDTSKFHTIDIANRDALEMLYGDNLTFEEFRPFSVILFGVNGEHKHDVDSPSFYNALETAKVVEICKSLEGFVDANGERVSSEHIGVIGAFRSQVLNIRVALRKANLGGVSVGSVEDFQGQEKRIIVISTVLSSRMPTLESNGSLGLFGDHKKFNVALTRGMQLTVVVGNPFALYADRSWRDLMQYCTAHNAYRSDSDSTVASTNADVDTDKDDSDLLRDCMLHMTLQDDKYEQLNDKFSISDYFHNDLEWRGLI